MANLEQKRFESPTRPGRSTTGWGMPTSSASAATTIGRGVFEPGWRWSSHVKPIAGTDSCQAAHTGIVMQGRMAVLMDDGTEAEVGPGDVVYIAARARRLDRRGRGLRDVRRHGACPPTRSPRSRDRCPTASRRRAPRLPGVVREHAAVDDEVGAGDPAGGVGDEEERGVGDVGRLTQPVERRRCVPARDPVGPGLLEPFGVDQTGSDAVDPHSLAGRARAPPPACA